MKKQHKTGVEMIQIIVNTLVIMYVIGYFAVLFSWFFSEESREYIRNGDVKWYHIVKGSFMWIFILYEVLRDDDL